MANTDVVLALPTFEYKGAYIESPFTAWAYSKWQLIDDSVKTNIAISGLTFMTKAIPAVDTTQQGLFEIGVGDIGNPIVKIQIPTSQRSDTAVGIYLPPSTIYLPEPHQVTAGNAIYLRCASSHSHQGYDGVRLLIQAADNTPVSPLNMLSNNFKHIHTENGISASTGAG